MGGRGSGTARGDRNGARRYPERLARGERHPRSKLTDAQVREIRQLLVQGMTMAAIGDRFGVDRSTIHGIKKGRTWRHVP
jgi:hypothetical protein